jgi:hypothetical protein
MLALFSPGGKKTLSALSLVQDSGENMGDENSGSGFELIVSVSPEMRGLWMEGARTILPDNALARPLFPFRPKLAEVLSPSLLEKRASYFGVFAPEPSMHALAAFLRNVPGIQSAYVKPKGSVPRVSAMPKAKHPSQKDLTGLQNHLGSAPGGIGARAAWKKGATGKGVCITDLESNWDFTHEDLKQHTRGVVVGSATDPTYQDHGTAVLGIIGASGTNKWGMTGIAYESSLAGAVISVADDLMAGVIDAAAAGLEEGDILLIEWELPGPRGACIPLEWWPDNLVAIRSAIKKGIVVVGAAGNWKECLDHDDYDRGPVGVDLTHWKNPFRLENASGSILVGAGNPPKGTHSRDHGDDRTRTQDSNYGQRVDVQGWGYEVATTGFGDRTIGTHRFTEAFYATSAAAAMVTGVIACVQSSRRKDGKTIWTSEDARLALRDDKNGTPQTGTTSERIGPRPDLAKLLKLP